MEGYRDRMTETEGRAVSLRLQAFDYVTPVSCYYKRPNAFKSRGRLHESNKM